MIRPPPISPLFPYTTLFRSGGEARFPFHRPRCPEPTPRTGPPLEAAPLAVRARHVPPGRQQPPPGMHQDRKSTRLNSSHPSISYAVFCLKKKKNNLLSSYLI